MHDSNRPFFLVLLFLMVGVVGRTSASEDVPTRPEEATETPGYYSVPVYDKRRDPNEDLQATVERATREDKRILLFVGGDWCVWCKAFERTVRDNEAVTKAMTDGFVVMKVDYSRWGRRGRFLKGYPKAAGFPRFYVLEKDGSLLHSQTRSDLENADGAYRPETVLAFLERWSPARNDNATSQEVKPGSGVVQQGV